MSTLMRVRAVSSGWTGGPGLNTFYFLGSEPPVTAEATEAVARVRAFYESLKTRMATIWTVQPDNSVDTLNDVTGALTGGLAGTAVAATTGTGLSTINDLASMAVIRINTGVIVNGRRLQGRHFIGPFDTGQTTSGGLAPATVTAFNTAANLLTTTIVTPILACVWHRPVGGAGGSHATVSTFATQTKLGVLRSRRDA
jgi:hypothetical protein